MSWNIRGLNNSVAKRGVKEYMSTHKVNVMCIQETKIECRENSANCNILDMDLFKWCGQDSIGLSGGLVTVWDSNLFKCVGIAQDQNWIWTVLDCLHDHKRLNVINVYAPQKHKAKMRLWSDLSKVIDEVLGEALCIVGDMNCIRNAKESANCIYTRTNSSDFNDFIDQNNLFDLEAKNGVFTWFGHGNKKSRLDRVLVNSCWMNIGDWCLETLYRKSSDHKALKLYLRVDSWGPKPFKVFNCWLNEDSLKVVLQDFWLNNNFSNDNVQVMLKKSKYEIK